MFGRPYRDVLEVGQVVVATSTQLERLLDKENPLVPERILVSGVKVDLSVGPSGELSLADLWPPPKFGDSQDTQPRIEIRDSVIAIREPTQTKPFELVVDEAVVLTKKVSPSSVSESRSTTIAAAARCAFAEEIRIHLEHSSEDTQFHARIRGGEYSADVLERLPEHYRMLAGSIGDLELSFDLGVDVKASADQPIDFAAKMNVSDGRYRHPQSSIPLKDIRGLLVCDSTGVDIKSLGASWGEAQLAMRSKQPAAYTWPSNASFAFSATNVLLDQRLEEVIPRELKQVWEKFEPRGMIDVTGGTLDVVAGKFDVGCDLTCKGVDISFERFPYPVHAMSGKIVVRNGRVRSQRMSGWIGGRLMNCMFDMPSQINPRAEKYFSVTVDGPLAIDSELLAALSPRGEPTTPLETFIRSLRPLGAIHLENATLRTDKEGVRHQSSEFTISDGSMRFEKFPYPLYNVTGRVRVEDDRVTLSKFQGSNANGGVIACEGVYHIPHPPEFRRRSSETAPGCSHSTLTRVGWHWTSRCDTSLPIQSQRTWDSLWPSGILDSLRIGLTIDEPGAPLDLTLVGRQFDSGSLGNDALRLQPASVPYRMDIVDWNAVRYQDGRVLIDSAARGAWTKSRVSPLMVAALNNYRCWPLVADDSTYT